MPNTAVNTPIEHRAEAPTTGAADAHARALAEVARLGPWLREQTPRIEATRHLCEDVSQALADAGLYTLLAPQGCGGQQLGVAPFCAMVQALAEHDAASAWCVMIGNTASVMAAYLAPEAAAELFSGPTTRASGVYAPRGQARRVVQDGVSGFIVNGRWAWGSGAHNAEVIVAGCLVTPEPDEAGVANDTQPRNPRVQLMLLRREQVKLLDNWASLGLCGSGSGEFEVHDAFVPERHSVCVAEDAPLAAPLYRFPIFGLLACGLAAVALGIAGRSLAEFTQLAVARVPQGSVRPLAERATAQEALAHATAQHRAARALLHEAVGEAWLQAERGEALSVDARRDVRLAASHATHASAAVVDRLHSLAGGAVVFADHPLARALRDVHVVTQHLMVAEPTFELAGRLLLGLPTNTAQL